MDQPSHIPSLISRPARATCAVRGALGLPAERVDGSIVVHEPGQHAVSLLAGNRGSCRPSRRPPALGRPNGYGPAYVLVAAIEALSVIGEKEARPACTRCSASTSG
jgi:hypothetical protein